WPYALPRGGPCAFVADGRRGLAAVAAPRGEDRRAARLLGASAAHRYGDPEDQSTPGSTRPFAAARTRCGVDAWDAAADHGGTMNIEDAIAYALEGPPA
ncbi:MAG: hypothetical protein ACXVW5_27640, partial [Solirubrobacteraceae bacterium]